MRRWLSPALAIALAVLGLLWLRDHDGKVVAEALAGARGDSLQIRHAELETLRREGAMKGLAFDALQAENDSTNARAERDRVASLQRERRATSQLANARSTLDATLDSLGPSADSIRAHLEAERDAHESLAESLRAQVGALSVQLLATDSSLVLERERIASRDVLIASLETALSEERGLREFYQGRADPGFLAELRDDLPKLVVTAGIAVLAWKMAR